MSFRSGGAVRRSVAVWSCAAVLVLAGCSGGSEETAEASKKPAVSEPPSASGPQDPRLQGEPLNKEQTREELCYQIVEYFPEEMVADASTAASKDQKNPECGVSGVDAGSGVAVKLHVSTWPLAPSRSVGEIDANLRSDATMCEKVLFSNDAQSKFLRVHAPKSYGERPDEYCGIKFTDEGHMSGEFIENAQNVGVEMWMEPAESVDSYEVREEIMPYIMEGVKNFHSDQ